MSEKRVVEYLGVFDAVVEHIFNILHRGVDLPPFMDFANVTEAHRQALMLHRTGNLNAYYERMQKGAV